MSAGKLARKSTTSAQISSFRVINPPAVSVEKVAISQKRQHMLLSFEQQQIQINSVIRVYGF